MAGSVERKYHRRGRTRLLGITVLEMGVWGLITLVLVGGILFFLRQKDLTKGVPAVTKALSLSIMIELEKLALRVNLYIERTGHFPGDSPNMIFLGERAIQGDANGRIEKSKGETDKIFIDLFQLGLLENPFFTIQSTPVEVLWAKLEGDVDADLPAGHYFLLYPLTYTVAASLDSKYDDGRSRSGNIVYMLDENKQASVYINMNLFL